MTDRLIGTLIGGEWHARGRVYEVTDPNDGSVIAEVADAGAAAAAEAGAAAAASASRWADTSIDLRRRVLGRAAERLARSRDALIDVAIADTGARRVVAEATQVDAAIARLRSWAAQPDETLSVVGPGPTDAGLDADIVRRPIGVIGCISPYNFPLLAMIGKVAPALFSGNTVVMKPAPQDPLLVAMLADALLEAGRAEGGPDGVVNLVVGSGAEAGAALVTSPDIGAISFTGSTDVGVEIYRAAAPGMKRLLLELGGKGAVIARQDADVDAVVAAVSRTWTYHAGQVCLTPARLLAPACIHDRLVGSLTEVLRSLRHGDPRDATTDVAPLITAVQRSRVDDLVRSARREGLEVHTSTSVPDAGYHYPAVLVTGATTDSTIMQQEVFGPVVSVMQVDDDDHAVEVANATKFGLYDYVFSADSDAARSIAARLESAQVGINTVARHPGAPFAGNKLSGIGRSGGTYAVDAYTNYQSVVKQQTTE